MHIQTQHTEKLLRKKYIFFFMYSDWPFLSFGFARIADGSRLASVSPSLLWSFPASYILTSLTCRYWGITPQYPLGRPPFDLHISTEVNSRTEDGGFHAFPTLEQWGGGRGRGGGAEQEKDKLAGLLNFPTLNFLVLKHKNR